MKTTSSLIPILVITLILFSQSSTLTAQCGGARTDPSFELVNNDICEGGLVSVENFSNEAGQDNVIYIWNWGDGSTDTLFNQANATHIYNFSSGDECGDFGGVQVFDLRLSAIVPGCPLQSGSVLKQVFVYFNPVAEFTVEDPFICLPNTGTQFINTTCTADSNIVYNWNFNDPASGAENTSNEANPQHVFSGAGTYDVSLTVQGSCNSTPTTMIQQVVVKEAPVATAALFDADRPDTLCAPFSISLTDQSTSVIDYQWQVTPNTGFSFIDGTDAQSPSPTIQIEEAGNYQILLIASNECAADTMSMPIEFDASKAPTVDLLPVDPACDELNYQPTVNINGNADNVSWTVEGTRTFFSNDLVPSGFLLPPGNYRATIEVSNICGTGSDVDSTIQVFDQPRVIVRPVDPLCKAGTPIQLDFTTSDTTGIWTGSGVTPDGLFDPQASGVVVGTNTLTYTVGIASCQVVRTLEVIVRDATSLDIGRDTALCEGSNGFFLQGTPMGGIWQGLGILDSLSGEFDPDVAGAGNHEITYVFFDAGNNCFARTTKDIEVQALPEINFESDTLFLCASGDSYRLEDNIDLDLVAANGRGIWTGPGVVDSVSGVFQTDESFLGTVNLFYTYQTSLGCRSSERLSVTLSEIIDVSAQRDVATCVSDSITRLLVTPDFGSWTAVNRTNPIEENGIVTVNDAGSYEYIYTLFPGTSCQSTDTVRLEVIDMATMTDAGDDFAICDASRGTITLRDNMPLGGQWSGAGVTNAITGTIDTRTFTEEQNVIYYEAESAVVRGCTAIDSIVITVDSVPIADFEVLDSVICSGNSIQFDNQSMRASTYSWTFGNSTPNPQESPSFSFTGGGIQEVTLRAFSQNGVCTDSTAQQIDITESPSVAVFDISDPIACVGTSTTFTDRSTGEDLEYLWDFGNGETSTLAQPRDVMYQQGIEDTLYFPTLTIQNLCGTTTFMDTVQVLPSPTAFFGTMLDEYCEGEQVRIQNSSFGAPSNYFWDYGNGRTSNDSIPESPVYSVEEEIIEFMIGLRVTNGCGEDEIQQTVRIRPSDVRAFFNIDSPELCVGDSLYLESFSTVGAIVEWRFGDNNSTGLRNPVYAYAEPGTYTLSHVAFGCGFDSIGIQVEVNERPIASFEVQEALCLGDTTVFINTSNAPTNTWNFGDGTELNLESPAYSYSNVGNYLVRLTASNKNCYDTFEEIVSVSEPPVFELELPDTICTGSPADLRIMVDEGYSRYSWDFGDNSRGSGRLTRHIFIDNGKFDISVEVENSEGCIVEKTGEIMVLPTPNADFAVDAFSLCTPSEIEFINTTLDADGFEWRFDQGDVLFTTDVNYRYEEEGDFQVQLIANFQTTCFDTMMQMIPIRSTPNVGFEIQNISCGGDRDGFVQILDTLNDFSYALAGPAYFQTNPNLFHSLGAGKYTLNIAADNGCDTTYQINLTQPQELSIDIREDSISILKGDAVPINVSTNIDSLSLEWVNLDKSSINEIDSSNYVLSPIESGLYILEATDGRCITSDSVYFEVLSREQVYLANAFSPNGDERNNYFYVQAGSGIADITSFQIFDRKGELVYEANNILPNNPLEGWDGSFNGEMMNQGVFVYSVQVRYKDGTEEIVVGDVLLVR